jgi:hypothetical protein
VADAGLGLAVLGANRTLIALAAPGEPARLIAAIFIVAHLALSIPALIAGMATSRLACTRPLWPTAGAIAALTAVAAGSLMLRRRGPATAPRTTSG